MSINGVTAEELIRRARFRKKLVRWLCSIGFVLFLGWGVSPYVKVGFNTTSSVDGSVFLIIKDALPVKGGLVAFWPPKNDFYENIWFVKYVVGEEGDRVSVQGRHFYINDEYLGEAKEKSLTGVELQQSGDGVIPRGYYFVWTPHKDSFDSRYEQIGWIHQGSVIGRAYRIF